MSLSSLVLHEDVWRYCGSFLDAATRRDSGVFPVEKLGIDDQHKFEQLFKETVPPVRENKMAWVSYVKRIHWYYSEGEEAWVEWTVMTRVLRNKSSVEMEVHREPQGGVMVLVDNEDFLYFWKEGSILHTYFKVEGSKDQSSRDVSGEVTGKVFKQFLYSF